MPSSSYSPAVQKVRRVAYIIQLIEGLTLGVEMFVWGPLFYEQIAAISSPEMGIKITAMLVAVVHLSGILLEVPTGAVGDAIGRKKTVALSYLFKMLCLLCLAIIPYATSIWAIVCFGVGYALTFAISYTLFSGTFTAWCVDSLREADATIGYESLLAPAYTMKFLGMLLGGAAGIFAYTQGVGSSAFLVGAMLCAGACIYSLGEMTDESTINYLDRTQLSAMLIGKRMVEIGVSAFSLFRRSPAILSAIFVYAGFMTTLNLVEYYWPIYLRSNVAETHQVSAWIALVVVTRLSSMAGSQGFSVFSRVWRNVSQNKMRNASLRRIFVGASVLAAIPIIWISWRTWNAADSFASLVAVVLTLLFVRGIIAPCFETLINNYVPDLYADQRATILSFASLLRSLLMIILAIPAGGANGETTTSGWVFPAAVLIVLAIVGNVVMKKYAGKAAADQLSINQEGECS